jgi:hypothetical protein
MEVEGHPRLWRYWIDIGKRRITGPCVLPLWYVPSQNLADRQAAVLTENGYLKLDPFIIYHPIYEAGLYLAAQAKEECLICVAGLKQYSIPFPSIWSLAEEIEVLYTSTKANLVVPAGDMVARQLPEKFIVDNLTPIPTASPHPQLNGEANGHWIPNGLDHPTVCQGMLHRVVTLTLFSRNLNFLYKSRLPRQPI